MRFFSSLLLVISLLGATGCAIKEKKAYKYDRLYSVAIMMPAEVVDKYEDDPEAYVGTTFPLNCGYVLIHAGKNTFRFVPTTDLPIQWVKKHMQQIAKEGGVTPGPSHFREIVQFNDEEFFVSFHRWLLYWHLDGAPIIVDNQGNPVRTPHFRRQCVYNSKNYPPVECGYTIKDLTDLLIR